MSEWAKARASVLVYGNCFLPTMAKTRNNTKRGYKFPHLHEALSTHRSYLTWEHVSATLAQKNKAGFSRGFSRVQQSAGEQVFPFVDAYFSTHAYTRKRAQNDIAHLRSPHAVHAVVVVTPAISAGSGTVCCSCCCGRTTRAYRPRRARETSA